MLSKKNLITHPKIEILLSFFSIFDGGCPLCKREDRFISPSSRHKPLSGMTYGSQAIHQDSGFNKTDAMKTLHGVRHCRKTAYRYRCFREDLGSVAEAKMAQRSN